MYLKTQNPPSNKEGNKRIWLLSYVQVDQSYQSYVMESLKYRTASSQYHFSYDVITHPSSICSVKLAQMFQKPA